MELNFLIVIICSYVIGSIPSGLVLGKEIWHVDLREHGSKNIGATNAWRTLGKFPGFVIFLADLIKGLLGVYLGMTLVGSSMAMILGGILAIVGHSASIFLKLKGGKGVATSLGVFLFLMPKVVGVLVLVFILVVGISKYISLGSVICAGLLPILAYFMPVRDDATRLPLVVISLIVGIFVIYKHKANIQRLMEGKENKFNLK